MASADPDLRHVLVAGGSTAEWASTSDADWDRVIAELGAAASSAGARWLTLRPVEGEPHPSLARRTATVGECTVTADPMADGRARFVAAAEALRAAGTTMSESTIAAALNEPAVSDPDLTVVLGRSDRLPPSLVWELAYTELVYLDRRWGHISGADLAEAMSSYAQRHRRFGGVD